MGTSDGGGLSLAGSVMSGWSAGAPSLSLAASGVASAEVSSACGSSTSGSGAGASDGSASGVEDATSGVEVELTDSGVWGSLILDGEEGTDAGVPTAPVWLNRTESGKSVTQTVQT